jgi:hypothetical protein
MTNDKWKIASWKIGSRPSATRLTIRHSSFVIFKNQAGTATGAPEST